MIALMAPPNAPQEPTLHDVLQRTGGYVVEFQRQLSGIVAEERYAQNVVATGNGLSRNPAVLNRVLKSDLLLVKPAGADRWIQFRDVFDVDGSPVRDRSERLMKLFVEPSTSTAKQVEKIIEESTRYNIGKLQRTINVPVLALVILDPVNQSCGHRPGARERVDRRRRVHSRAGRRRLRSGTGHRPARAGRDA